MPTVGQHQIPEELISARVFGGVESIELCSRLSDVATVELLCVARDAAAQTSGVGYRCFFLWGATRSHVAVDRLQWPFYAYLPSSISYPRHFIYIPNLPADPYKQVDFNSVSLYIFKNVDVHHFVYAVDVDAKLQGRYCDRTIRKCHRRDVAVQINQGQQCLHVPRSRAYRSQFVKLFVRPLDGNQLNARPVGYEIRNSVLLEFDMDDIFRVRERIYTLDKDVGQDVKKVGVDLAKEYRILSVNTAILNAIRHFLSHDLLLSYFLSKLQFIKLEKFVNLAILIHDILQPQASSLISLLLNQNDIKDIARILIDNIIKNGENMLKTTSGILLKHIISTTHHYRVESFKSGIPVKAKQRTACYNNILLRLVKLLDEYEKADSQSGNQSGKWYRTLLLEISRHTYHHHMIKSISTEARVSPDKILEGFIELYRGRAREGMRTLIRIFEREAGGLGFLERVTENMAKDRYTGFRRFILTFGQCLIGTPEDVLHFLLATRDENLCSVSKLKKVIADFAASELNIVLTPEELEESARLLYSICAEAERLIEVLPHKQAGGHNLLHEIHKARYELERRINRFPELDELIVHLLINMRRGSLLRELVKQFLERSLDATGYNNSLKQRYGQNYLDEFIDDVKNVLKNNCQGQSRSVICNSRQGWSFSDDISHALKALGRIMRGILLRLALLTCNSACGYCYVNAKSCSRYSAPFIQARTLDRRVAKILVSDFIKLQSQVINDYYDSEELDIVIRFMKSGKKDVNKKDVNLKII